jgi:hypothetical protein
MWTFCMQLNLLSRWCWALLDKLPVAQLLKIFPSMVHYRVRKYRPFVHVLTLINPVSTTPLYLSKIQLNIFLPPTSRTSSWFVFLWFSHKNLTYISLRTHACYMTYTAKSIFLDLMTLIIFIIINCNWAYARWQCYKKMDVHTKNEHT